MTSMTTMSDIAPPLDVLHKVVAPSTVVTWSEKTVAEYFNSGTMQGQKIFLELTQGPPDGKRFTNSYLELAIHSVSTN